MPETISIPCAELRHLYEEMDMGIVEIARHFGCSPSTISIRLRECNITVRPARFQGREVQEEEIRRLYLEEQLPVREIARRLGMSISSFNYHRRRFQLQRRQKPAQEPSVEKPSCEEEDKD